MFNCPDCKKTSLLGEKGQLVVVKQHMHTFPARQDAHCFKETGVYMRRGRQHRTTGHWVSKDDPGGKGYQIDQEIRICPRCARLRGVNAAQRPDETVQLHKTNLS